jgi:hypothetical protein
VILALMLLRALHIVEGGARHRGVAHIVSCEIIREEVPSASADLNAA